MAEKTYTSRFPSLKVGFGEKTVTVETKEKAKIIEFAEGSYTTSDEDEQEFLEGDQFANQIDAPST